VISQHDQQPLWALCFYDETSRFTSSSSDENKEFTMTHQDQERDQRSKRVAIIGGGISGLSAAIALKQEGARVMVFDKGRRLGGRLTVRRFDGLSFHMGARPQELEVHAHDGGVFERAIALTKGAEGHPLERLTRSLSAQLNAEEQACSTRITGLYQELDGLYLEGDQHLSEPHPLYSSPHHTSWGPFEALVIALPSPQAANLLFHYDNELALRTLKARYAPQLVALVSLSAPLSTPHDLLTWEHPVLERAERASLEALKEGQALEQSLERGADGWTLYATEAWSREHIELDKEEIAAHLVSIFCELCKGELCDDPPHVLTQQGHRWRYALPTYERAPQGVSLDQSKRVVLCGDWTTGPTIKDAYMSGLEAAKLLR
jgi:predicted NAD/FAD-dependent oxidoreductase